MPEQFSRKVEVLDRNNKVTVTIDADLGDIMLGGGATVTIGPSGSAIVRGGALGSLILRSPGGVDVITLGRRAVAPGPVPAVRGDTVIGDIVVKNINQKKIFEFHSGFSTLYIGNEGNAGAIIIRDSAGKTRIHLDGEDGDIKLQGADCAEEFDMANVGFDSGTVMVIDNESTLIPCNKPYDKKVAGVISGGNGTNPGIILDKRTTKNQRLPVALSGKVYCKVDAQYNPIKVGDLLTTSSTIGHGMKADNPLEAFGAVIGKALGSLREGTGIIPILVALQ